MKLGLSPCPNDTFIFHALLHGLVDTGGFAFQPVMEDVEELNLALMAGRLPVTKASFAAFARVRDRYCALRTGGALGRGNGPLVVAREPLTVADLERKSVMLPGDLTTAALLFRSFHPGVTRFAFARYDEVPRALARGEVDAGVVIHELRFEYERLGFHLVEDLGERWERETGLPVPLGGIFVRRDLTDPAPRTIERWVRKSLEVARRDPTRSATYVRAHSQSMDPVTLSRHIETFVNEHSLDYGEEGERAITTLIERAVAAGAAPAGAWPLFAD